MAVDSLKGLNKNQREAVLVNDKPLLILAGAGSGKTRVLTQKIAHLILRENVSPRSILAMTFTNKAAGEMKKRISKILGYSVEGLWIGTFHSLFARILRSHAGDLGFKTNFTIYDREDSLKTVRIILNQFVAAEELTPKEVLWAISRAKNTPASGYTIDAQQFPNESLFKIYQMYDIELKKSNAMDFDDLLVKPLQLFLDKPDVLKTYQQLFSYILIDEFQDTNLVQFELAKLLAGNRRQICVVGDEDQSIYGWRGANIDNILTFTRSFPNAVTIKLEQNYRSYSPILAVANAVVKNNVSRIGKNLVSVRGEGNLPTIWECSSGKSEARKVMGFISTMLLKKEYRAGDIAVLYRINAQSRLIEDELTKNGVAYEIVGGLKFYERKEIKDAIAYLRILINPDDLQAFTRVITTPRKGIGKKTLSLIINNSRQQGISLLHSIKNLTEKNELKGKALTSLESLTEHIENSSVLNGAEITAGWVESFLHDTGLISYYEEQDKKERDNLFSDIADRRTDNIYQLIDSINEFAQFVDDEQFDISLFLQEVQLQTDIDEWNESPEKITLMTIHQAKGLEFPVVIIIGLEQGLLPLSRNFDTEEDLEEERRLFYVAATRAEDLLYMMHARERFRYGQKMFSLNSQFLDEIPEELALWETEVSKNERFYVDKKRGIPENDEPYYDYADSQISGHLVLNIGMEVAHPVFGEGKIINVEGRGANSKITVIFYNGNFSKKLVQKYAKLEVIE